MLKILIVDDHAVVRGGLRQFLAEAGAAGFLPKDSDPADILDAVRHAGRGERYLSPQLAEKLLSGVACPGRKEPHDLLSEREFAVMRLLSRGIAITAIGDRKRLGER